MSEIGCEHEVWIGNMCGLCHLTRPGPHGVFEFVSVEDGHYVDPNDMSYDAVIKRQTRKSQKEVKL